jgi:hypothetical protein
MLRDHRQILVTFADKFAVREYVASVVGEQYLPRLLAVLNDPADVYTLDLPEAYVVKPTHGSGAVVVVSAAAAADTHLPGAGDSWVYRHVRPHAVVPADLEQLCAAWLDDEYGQGPNREWAYGRVPRRVIVEELLSGPDGPIPDDYKLFIFHERCQFIQVDRGRFGGRTQDFYTPAWEHVALSGGFPWAAPEIARPDRLDEMIEVGQKLARDTDFVRVDMYVLSGRIVVGELTNYPAGGDSPFYPETFNAAFGSHWTVPKRYVED